jgi:hypothetical protein
MDAVVADCGVNGRAHPLVRDGSSPAAHDNAQEQAGRLHRCNTDLAAVDHVVGEVACADAQRTIDLIDKELS